MIRAQKRRPTKIIFVTGTGTGVGKTILTALLVHHLRQQGCHALAMKPFCCGSRADVRMLRAAQSDELTLDEINPFYFRKPVAPLVAGQQVGCRLVQLREVLRRIKIVEKRCDFLVIEGCGGLLVPLGENYSVKDLISNLNCRVLIVGKNQLGTINHTLLTAAVLKEDGINASRVVLMENACRDVSAETNQKTLEGFFGKHNVVKLQFLSQNIKEFTVLKNTYKKVKKTLAQILA